MPKPTRRERRLLAEKGKLQPRRPAPSQVNLPADTASAPAPVARTSTRNLRAASRAASEPTHIPDAQEYAHVKADLLRILVLAGLLTGGMVALRFVLPQ